MSGNFFHAGELEVQKRAGVAKEAARVAGVMRSSIPPVAAQFLQQQPMLILATTNSDSVWASMIFGNPGFATAVDEHTVEVNVRLSRAHLPFADLSEGAPIGILAIDPSTRRRAKFKGSILLITDQSFTMAVDRCYALCPKYIQAREIISQHDKLEVGFSSAQKLSESQQAFLSKADTFFIATFHPETRADASHRGGNPGFIQVVDDQTLIFPDYSGNNMFNTLGNLTANPKVGLVFPDFDSKKILQLTGTASIVWDQNRVSEFAGAERLVEFHIEKVIQADNALPYGWQFMNYSPFNPK